MGPHLQQKATHKTSKGKRFQVKITTQSPSPLHHTIIIQNTSSQQKCLFRLFIRKKIFLASKWFPISAEKKMAFFPPPKLNGRPMPPPTGPPPVPPVPSPPQRCNSEPDRLTSVFSRNFLQNLSVRYIHFRRLYQGRGDWMMTIP